MVNSGTPIVSNIHRLSITQGNLVFQPVDAIVNPTNSILNHIGLCSDIHKIAGDNLRKATRDIKWLEVSNACITPGFALKASHVIHTCAPIWDKEHSQASWKKLRECYLNCLETAANNQIHTLAFPCIGTRLRGFPKDWAACIALKEILLFVKSHSFPWQVNIVCRQLEDYEQYQAQLSNPQINQLIKDLKSQNSEFYSIPYSLNSTYQTENQEFRQTFKELSEQIPNGLRLAVIGNNSCNKENRKVIYQKIGESLASIDNLILLTGGRSGFPGDIVHSFWENTKEIANKVFHIQPHGCEPLDYGNNLYVGKSLEDRQKVLAQINPVYLLIEGASDEEKEVKNALSMGAKVIPVGGTGGFAHSLYQKMHCPYYIPKHLWEKLGNLESITPRGSQRAIAPETTDAIFPQIILQTFSPPRGVICHLDRDEVTDKQLKSAVGVDYRKLMVFLTTHQWEAADRETFRLLCEIISRVEAQERLQEIDKLLQTINSRANIQQYQQLEQQKADCRKYLQEIIQQEFPISSFYDVSSGCLNWSFIYKIPLTDLKTIDLLWIRHSKGHFGFSAQERILQTIWAEFGFIPSLDPDNDVFAASEEKLRNCLGKSYHLSQSEPRQDFYQQNESNFSLDNLPGTLPWLNWRDNQGNFHGIEFHGRFDCLFPGLGLRGVFTKILADHFLIRIANGETNFSNCILSNFDLYEQNLQGLNLRNSILIGANLKNTNLSCSDLTGADLRGANLEGANLTNTILDDTNCLNAIFSNTIFIIDDSITVLELLSRSFTKVGYKVATARDGKEAWEKLQQGLQCHVIFCDIEMPKMNGLELYRNLQKYDRVKDIPFVLLTSRGVSKKRDRLMQELGIKGYFTKPYVEELLLDAAQKLIRGEKLDNLTWNQ